MHLSYVPRCIEMLYTTVQKYANFDKNEPRYLDSLISNPGHL